MALRFGGGRLPFNPALTRPTAHRRALLLLAAPLLLSPCHHPAGRTTQPPLLALSPHLATLPPNSGFADRGINATASDWMRGAAITRPDGRVLFRSVIPGWYPGRLAHVHVKVRLAGLAAPIAPAYSYGGGGGGWRGFTTQLYLPDPLVRSVYANPPYRSLGGYDSDVGRDIVLAGNAAQYAALTMDLWPATTAWVEQHGLTSGTPDRWGTGYVAKYTLRLRA